MSKTEPLIIEEAAHLDDITMNPQARLKYIREWYKQASPYHFTWLDIFNKKKRNLRTYYLGMDVEMFSAWELQSSRIPLKQPFNANLNYWNYVNSNFIRDLQQAEKLYQQDQSTSDPRIQYFVDFLNKGREWNEQFGKVSFIKRWKKAWFQAFHHHFLEMCRLFWLSHNTSIVYWDYMARKQGIYQQEDSVEQLFINGVIIRVDFTASLPIRMPIYGNMVIPIGLIGEFLNHGPFRYPHLYPAPMPDDVFDFSHHANGALLHHYISFFLNRHFSAVFTWWIPTPADSELEHLLHQHGLTLEASPSSWLREVLEPAEQTVEGLHHKYLRGIMY